MKSVRFDQIFSRLRRALGDRVEKDVPLASHTSWRVGGPAAIFGFAEQLSDLRLLAEEAVDAAVPYLVIGRGTNLLVSDTGFAGIIIRLSGGFRDIAVYGSTIQAGGAATLASILHTAVRNDLQGLSFSAGIPGSLGGALATNAGAYGMSVGDIVSEATLFSPKTGLTRARGSDLSFSYRRSGVSDRGVLVEARVELESGDPVRIRGELERFSRKRRNSQPLASHTAGSVFKNPAGGFAGQLIDDAGLKGHAVGHAEVSARHANFIVNRGSCSADDIFQLMKKVQREVSLASGHVLEPEVNLIGEFKGSLLRKPSSEGKVAGA